MTDSRPAPTSADQASAGFTGSADVPSGSTSSGTPARCYVLDTSVLLSDPWSLLRFDEHQVVLPLVVISELEAKRHHPELGWFARTALRELDDLRVKHGRLDAPIPVGDKGGTLHVELNHSDPMVLPAGFRTDSNDSRILACALNLRADPSMHGEVVLVTKDIPLRVKAAAVGLRGRRVPRPGRGLLRLDRDERDRGHRRARWTRCSATA